MFRPIPIVICLMMCVQVVHSAEPANGPQERSYTAAGSTTAVLQYRFLAPANPEAGKKYPLLLCLHGAGERGEDNAKQVGHFRPLITDQARKEFPAFVIIPQVPKNQTWATYGWSHKTQTMAKDPSPVMALTKALLDEIIAKEPVDPKRIYITGLSMGGYGTWEAIQRWPDFFAAAVPICGGGDVVQAERISKLPIWAFHGDKDKTISPECTQRTITAIEAAGGKPKFTLFPGVAHGSWGPAFADATLLPWLFAQKR